MKNFVKVDFEKNIEEMSKEERFLYEVEGVRLELIKNCIKKREELGLSQEDVAKKAGLSQQQISRLETYGCEPNTQTFVKYLYGLGIDINKLF